MNNLLTRMFVPIELQHLTVNYVLLSWVIWALVCGLVFIGLWVMG
jgi:hypothetical protein